MDAEHIQRSHFAKAAGLYDTTHIRDEHDFALEWLCASIPFLGVTSLLDVGAGTGRAIRELSTRMPSLSVAAVEPVKEMREIGYEHGIPRETLIDGDAQRLPFESQSFDIVTAFALLHHVRRPELVIAEMCRVARLAIFVSDCNNFGHGSPFARMVKGVLKGLHLWRAFVLLRTRGRGYDLSDGDGASFSYSVFDSLPQMRREFPNVYILNTRPADSSYLRFGASHVAVLAAKRSW